ncbi:hypothetical protein G9A89_004710 [Geosiphon pyriformis]|nr:hypothetical protein G9A89_004710 [Geosiphon pyriformis]
MICRILVLTAFLCNLGTVDMKAGAAVFFENINSGLGVSVSGLVSSTLTELQAIALALECIPSFCLVDLFSDSQAALDACRLESLLVGLDFRNCCWIERCHIANVIRQKNLDINWIKVKDYSSVLGNKHADVLAKGATLSAWCLSYLVSERFLKAGGAAVFSNSRHFVHDVFRSVHCACWEIGSGSRVVPVSLHPDIDWLWSSLALHHRLPVAVWKHLYNKCYASVMCLFCGDIEVSDHIFSCLFDAAGHVQLFVAHVLAWEAYFSLVQFSSCVSQLLSICIADAAVSTALYKGFVFGGWYQESLSVFKDSMVVASNIVDFVHGFCVFFRDDI